jgi:hypothetical protein
MKRNAQYRGKRGDVTHSIMPERRYIFSTRVQASTRIQLVVLSLQNEFNKLH